MFHTTPTFTPPAAPSRLDRALSLFTDVRAGEGATALLMLANIFLLLVCYSVIKTVREPLILLGGGAEVRSVRRGRPGAGADGIRAAVQLVRLARRAARKLLVGVTLFFIACIELFALGGGGARAVRRRRVLHLGRHLQHVAGRAVLVVRQRHLQQGGRATGCSRSS